MTIKTGYVCPVCNKNHLKDSSVSGDYDQEGTLLSFCPICGRMYYIQLSQTQRKIIAVKLAMRCDLDFKETKQVAMDAPKECFFDYIIETLHVIKEDILAVIETKEIK